MQLKPLLRFAALPLAFLAPALQAAPIPIEHIAREPAIRSVSMSLDGKQLAAIVAAPGSDYRDTALATWDLDNFDAGPTVTPSGDKMKFIGAQAIKAGAISVVGRQEMTAALGGCGEGNALGSEATFIVKNYLTDMKHSEFEEAFESGDRMLGASQETKRCAELNVMAGLVTRLPLEEREVIIRRTDMMTFSTNLYRYDLKTGRATQIFRGSPESQPDLLDPRTGEILVRSDTEAEGSKEYITTIEIRNPDTGDFEVHDALTNRLTERININIVGIDDASGKYYVLTDKFSDLDQVWMYDPKSRKFDAEPALTHPKFSIAGIAFGNQPSNFNQPIAFAVDGRVREWTYIDPDMASIHEGLKQVYPDQTITLQSYTDDLSRVLFTTVSNRHPTSYHLLYDRQSVKTIGSQRPWINPDDLGQQKWVTYPARDGMEIPALLDLPAGYDKDRDGPLPTVVNPHGGPWSRDFGNWSNGGWVEFLTSRGFAVLRPQYRGSTGLGRKLWTAGDAQWGLAMQDDKDDGVAWLVKQGFTDPERVMIFGYSYGGFAAAAAVVRPDGPYRCAISGAPVTDLTRLGNRWSQNRLQRLLQGDTVKGMDPMDNADKADIPVLLYVGSRDVRTPDWHAKDFYNAVKDQVPARLEIIEDMPHSLPWYYRHHEQTLTLIEDFMEKECGFGDVSSGLAMNAQ